MVNKIILTYYKHLSTAISNPRFTRVIFIDILSQRCIKILPTWKVLLYCPQHTIYKEVLLVFAES